MPGDPKTPESAIQRRTCRQCATAFTVRSPSSHRIFCAVGCKERWWAAHREECCKHCHTPFLRTKKVLHVYCSRACAEAAEHEAKNAAAREHNAQHRATLICKWCFGRFQRPRGGRYCYCSPRCATAANEDQHRTRERARAAAGRGHGRLTSRGNMVAVRGGHKSASACAHCPKVTRRRVKREAFFSGFLCPHHAHRTRVSPRHIVANRGVPAGE